MYFGSCTMTSKKSTLAATGEGGMWHTMTWGLLLEHISSFHHIPVMGTYPHSHTQTSSTYFILYNMHQPILWTYTTHTHTYTHSQFDGFVPVDDIAGEDERLDVDNMDIAPLCSNVQPLTLEWQVTVCYPEWK